MRSDEPRTILAVRLSKDSSSAIIFCVVAFLIMAIAIGGTIYSRKVKCDKNSPKMEFSECLKEGAWREKTVRN